jgi:hypothetical protein
MSSRCENIFTDCTANIKNYFKHADAIPEYGYEQNVLEGLGTLALMGAQVAICWLDADSSSILGKISAVALLILTLPITLLGIITRTIGTWLPHPFTEATDVDLIPENTPVYRRLVDETYDLLSAFHEVAEEVGLPYIIMDGTALGAARHGGMIPWDDDGDLGYLKKDITPEKEAAIRARLEAKGILFQSQPEALSGYLLKFPGADAKGTVDLFALVPTEDGERVVFDSEFFRVKFQGDYFLKDEVLTADGNLSTELYGFGPADRGLMLRMPRAAIITDYLHRYYGPTCLEFGALTHSHWNVPIPCTDSTIRIPIPRFPKRCRITSGCAQGDRWTGKSLVTLHREARAAAAAPVAT